MYIYTQWSKKRWGDLYVQSTTAHVNSLTSITFTNTIFAENTAASGGAIELIQEPLIVLKTARFKTTKRLMLRWSSKVFRGGATAISPVTFGGHLKEIISTRFQDNIADEGPDIFSGDTCVTTTIRDSAFLTLDGSYAAPRTIGNVARCVDATADNPICPFPYDMCKDTNATSNSEYGVTCHIGCNLGSYGYGPDACLPCSAGKYGALVSPREADACISCPKGRFNALPAQPGKDSCKVCDNGTYASIGAPQCYKVCQRGQEQVSQSTCENCPAGQTSDDSPQPRCVPCSPGTIAPKPKSPFCDRCPSGKASNKNSHDARPAQWEILLDGWSQCTECALGKSALP